MLANGSTLSFALKFANPARVNFNSTLQVLRTIEVPANAPSLIGVVATGGTSARLVGRVEGAPNQDVSLQLSSASTCVAGTLVSGVAGATVVARTDSAGYFGVNVAGVNPGDFVALKTVAGNALSLCQVSSRDNDSWPKAFPLDTTNLTASDFIDSPGKARWYKVAITPGQRIQVVLSNLPADYDLAVFKDIAQAFANQFNPATAGVNDLVKLAAEYAPSTFSPSTFSPSTFSPGRVYAVDVLAIDVQPVAVLAVDVQPVDVQPVDVLAIDVQPVDVLAVDVQPVYVQPLDVLAVHLHRDRDPAGILDGPDEEHPLRRRDAWHRQRIHRRQHLEQHREFLHPRRRPQRRVQHDHAVHDQRHQGTDDLHGCHRHHAVAALAARRIGTQDGHRHRFVESRARRRIARARRRNASRQARRVRGARRSQGRGRRRRGRFASDAR